MNYQAFTNESLTMMYAAVRGALNADIQGPGYAGLEEARRRSGSRNAETGNAIRGDRLV
jgi:hypothetical protein